MFSYYLCMLPAQSVIEPYMCRILRATYTALASVRHGKFASSAEHPVWQRLQFQVTDAFRKFPGGSGIRHCRT